MDEDGPGGFYSEPKTLTAAQRKKLKKKQQALEQETEREVERASAPDLRLAEEVDINKQLEEVNKKIFKILGDGNCLFRAIEHQLVSANQRGSRLPLYDHCELRHRTVQHLLKHKDEYQAFVTASGEDHGGDDNLL
ncbi:OTU domain-containing protein 6B, putative [Babesia ovis]|uniref:OTU domain-containing protein 6B, putative n=1 Tax=Babesia ovis TaxID=5869 RepID=A0A9W5TEV1_BABOV|nr:OTU domain-containing protein 6B, putative [Babesia ovis]